MRRLTVIGLLVGSLIPIAIGVSELPEPEVAHPLQELTAGQYRIVDLTYPLNEKNAYWPGEKYHSFQIETLATIEEDGVFSQAVSFPEHLGTHIDAPNHFVRDQSSVDELKPKQLFGPGVVIDVSKTVQKNVDYQLSREDIQKWEDQYGPIPEGAIVLLNTGWSRYWSDYEKYKNESPDGTLHFPAFSAEAARFLVEKRKVRGIGLDTLSLDPGISEEFPVHHIVGRAGKFGLENLAHLDQLPPRGFTLLLAPLKIEGGSGGPSRVYAVLAR